MTVSSQTRSGELSEVLKTERSVINNQLRVALPGIVQSFDPNTVTAVIQPAIRYIERDSNGNESTHDYRCLWMCLYIFRVVAAAPSLSRLKLATNAWWFSDRCIDFWWQNGGVQEPVDPRQHDLSDAFAFIGPQSQAQKISGISTTSVQVRTDDGISFIELMQGGNVNITTPLLTVNGNVQINGTVTSTGDQVAKGISQTGHVHSGVQSGSSQTGGPQ